LRACRDITEAPQAKPRKLRYSGGPVPIHDRSDPVPYATTSLATGECEYSLMEQMLETDILPLCRDENIGFVAFSIDENLGSADVETVG